MKRRWPATAGLILLSVIPVAGGAFRLAELTGGAEVTTRNARFFDAPLPVVLHIIGAVVFSLLGAWQFMQGRHHRVTGRIVVPCGLVLGLSGLWMTVFYDSPDGPLLAAFRLVFGSAMVVSLVLGVLAVRRRDIRRHRAWMIRGYAIGMAAGTQALVTLLWAVPFGTPAGLTAEMLLCAGWVINLVFAELVISGRTHASDRARPVRLT